MIKYLSDSNGASLTFFPVSIQFETLFFGIPISKDKIFFVMSLYRSEKNKKLMRQTLHFLSDGKLSKSLFLAVKNT